MHQSSIDQLFRSARATEPYIEDAGFTAKVQTKLRQRHLQSLSAPSKLPILILMLATLLGAGIFYQMSPVELWVGELLAWLNSGLTLVVAGLGSIAFAFITSVLLAGDRL